MLGAYVAWCAPEWQRPLSCSPSVDSLVSSPQQRGTTQFPDPALIYHLTSSPITARGILLRDPTRE